MDTSLVHAVGHQVSLHGLCLGFQLVLPLGAADDDGKILVRVGVNVVQRRLEPLFQHRRRAAVVDLGT